MTLIEFLRARLEPVWQVAPMSNEPRRPTGEGLPCRTASGGVARREHRGRGA